MLPKVFVLINDHLFILRNDMLPISMVDTVDEPLYTNNYTIPASPLPSHYLQDWLFKACPPLFQAKEPKGRRHGA
jgi:hypothetical protein